RTRQFTDRAEPRVHSRLFGRRSLPRADHSEPRVHSRLFGRPSGWAPTYSATRTPAATGHRVATCPAGLSVIHWRSIRSSAVTVGDSAASRPAPPTQNRLV